MAPYLTTTSQVHKIRVDAWRTYKPVFKNLYDINVCRSFCVVRPFLSNFFVETFFLLLLSLPSFLSFSGQTMVVVNGGAKTLSITAFSIKTLSIMTLSVTKLGITTFLIMAFSIMTVTITTFSIMTLSITILSKMTFSIIKLSIFTHSVMTLSIRTLK
jgi:hypothetical protein